LIKTCSMAGFMLLFLEISATTQPPGRPSDTL
jgi:hypothetical protein